MARENQGLQIALILLVMAMIVLSVTTYLGFKNYSDEFKDKQLAVAEGVKAQNQNTQYEEQIKKLKKFIGAADSDQVSTIEDHLQRRHEDLRRRLSRGFALLS